MLDRDERLPDCARYDGYSAWYDQRLGAYSAASAGEVVERFLGRGSGRCLDLCCGTGVHLQMLRELGWQVTGADISNDQLQLARERGAGVELVRADAAALPFPDGYFRAVVSMFSHTDVDDFGLVMREAARVLEPGGLLVYLGLHPCFVGPHTRLATDQAVPDMYAGYSKTGRHMEGPGISPDGLWARVGGVHLTMADVLTAFLGAPLSVERFEEPGDDDYPRRIALRARRDE
jgi:SAM-dependent methyltransferase